MAAKGKWFLLMLMALIVLGACSGSPVNTTNPTLKQRSNQLVVIVQGLNSGLGTTNIAGNGGYGDVADFASIESSMKKTKEFSGAQYMAYSYNQTSGLDGQPSVYDCNATYSHQIALDEAKLATQITAYTTNHKNTQVYIISHSLGGDISFAFLADLVGNSHSLALANGGVLKGVAIMDTPLGGVLDNSDYFRFVWALAHVNIGIGPGCNPLHVGQESYKDLTTLLKNAHDKINLGASASIYQDILGTSVQPKKYISNQDIASQAANLGARILVIGNTNDILWQPDLCNSVLNTSLSNFLSTEFLNDIGKQTSGGSLFVRSFTSGNANCSALALNAANHLDVIHKTEIGKTIWEVFTGKSVDFTAYHTSDFSRFVGEWKQFADWLTITANGEATYQGRTHAWCDTYHSPPCDGGNYGLDGLNTTIAFTDVNGYTASGVITGGTGDRDQHQNIIPVGGSITITLKDKDHLHVSDGRDLTNCKDLPNEMACTSNT
jgi:hypothetical protein